MRPVSSFRLQLSIKIEAGTTAEEPFFPNALELVLAAKARGLVHSEFEKIVR
jgi:hypothetical protein